MNAEFRTPQEEAAHIQELERELMVLELGVLSILDSLPDIQRQLLDGFLCGLRELQMLQVQFAYRQGQRKMRTDHPKK